MNHDIYSVTAAVVEYTHGQTRLTNITRLSLCNKANATEIIRSLGELSLLP